MDMKFVEHTEYIIDAWNKSVKKNPNALALTDERHPRGGSRHVPFRFDRDPGFRHLCAQRLRRHPRYVRYLQFRLGGPQQRFFRTQWRFLRLPQQRWRGLPQQRLRFPQQLLCELPDFSFHP